MNSEYIHPALLSPEMLLAECTMQRVKRSGPGGQRRNKVETAVLLLHQPTQITAEASERRSVAENLPMAIRRLRLNCALEVRSDSLARNSPTELWRSRCRNEKIIVNEAHADFPALLAEALDVLHSQGYRIAEASQQLGCTSSQLMKLLQKEPRAWQILNDERAKRGAARLT